MTRARICQALLFFLGWEAGQGFARLLGLAPATWIVGVVAALVWFGLLTALPRLRSAWHTLTTRRRTVRGVDGESYRPGRWT